MPRLVESISKRFAIETLGSVAIVVSLSLPVLLGFGALAIEYGGALVTRSENQRTSDITAYAAAFEYKKNSSKSTGQKVDAATAAAGSVASLNGVTSGITVNFDNPADAKFVDVTISEDKPIFLSRLLVPNASVTITATSRVSLGGVVFTPCILALGDGKKAGFTANGNAGSYNVTGCGIGSNGEIAVNGQVIDARCAAAGFKNQTACEEEIDASDFVDPIANITEWPTNSFDDAVCHHTGSLLDDLSTKVSGKKNSGDYQLKEGVLCVDEFSNKFGSVFSDPDGIGNTLIFKAGVDFNMSGGKQSLSVTPQTTGNFAGVGVYGPNSEVTVSGNATFSIVGFNCFGLIANSITFNGNVDLNAECDKSNPFFDAGLASQPKLVR